jgi:hypothetical protein
MAAFDQLGDLTQLSFIASLLIAAYCIYVILRFGHREKHLPPGPPTWPILGNAHLLMAGELHYQYVQFSPVRVTDSLVTHTRFTELSKKYGSIFSLKIGKSTMIILNDPRAVYELIHKKSALYLDRPYDEHWDLAYRNESIALMHSDVKYKAMRKIVQQLVSPKNLDTSFSGIQEAEWVITSSMARVRLTPDRTNRLMLDLLEKPEEFDDSIKRTTASIIGIILYGFRATSPQSFWATVSNKPCVNLQE